jgi:hypothetical protein
MASSKLPVTGMFLIADASLSNIFLTLSVIKLS